MIKIFAELCPSVSDHLLIKVEIMKVLNPEAAVADILQNSCF